jgi:hypothetical protein
MGTRTVELPPDGSYLKIIDADVDKFLVSNSSITTVRWRFSTTQPASNEPGHLLDSFSMLPVRVGTGDIYFAVPEDLEAVNPIALPVVLVVSE